MKRSLSLALTLLCLLFLPGVCSAQFQNHFNLYTAQSLDNDTITIHQTVTLDGYTVVPPGMPSNVVHTPHVQNKIGSTGGWYIGPGVCPSCHITYSTNISHQQIGNLIEEDDTGANVVCTIAGVFFTISSIIYNVHISQMNYILVDNDAVNCYYTLFCPNGFNEASCPNLVNITDAGGMLITPYPCSHYTYAHIYRLVVNYECIDVGIFLYSNFAIDCD